jgi:DNA-binding CsgD family transcriptional regulator
MLSAALKYASGSLLTRLPQLSQAVCEMFDADGCVIALGPEGRSGRHQIAYSRGRAAHWPAERVRRLLVRQSDAVTPVLLLGSRIEGGPAIIVRAAMGDMLIYRLDVLGRFSDQDAELAGVLWRSCGSSEPVVTASPPTQPIEGLGASPRVREVLGYLLDGFAEKQIASRLCISHHTVHVYVKDLYRQLGVNSRAQLLVRCLKQGITSKEISGSVVKRRPTLVRMKLEQRHIQPGNQIIATTNPVSAVDGADANMLFR